ncbi:MAG: ABC transporter substrate-binding protein [Firmicutes bacterium]|nr:ABC transporter substrate-binding protein [Bacillota bacterium]
MRFGKSGLVQVLLIGILTLTFSSLCLGASYYEAPMLTEMVKAGKLPSVDERLPKEPIVITPVEMVGSYGGTMRVVTVRPQIMEDGGLINNHETIIRLGADGKTIEANLATAWELSEDGKTLTLRLREGVRWSDGHPFDADDIMFWYEDIVLDDELTPVKPRVWSPGGYLVEIEKLDDYTLEFNFAEPYPLVLTHLMHSNGYEGGMFYPKHYLMKYHYKYASEEEIQQAIAEGGFETWAQMFLAKAQINAGSGRAVEPETPTVKPFKVVAKTLDKVIYERNPYYWKVDTAGNQLPYIDRLEVEILKDQEMVNLKIVAGEVDFAAFNTTLENYPLYKENEDNANIRVLLWPDVFGAELLIMLNLTHQNPVIREIFQDIRFRAALSLGINREEMNELFFLGLAEPRQATVVPASAFYEEEFANAYVEYDPDEANRLLDEMGLNRGSDGVRLRPDGKPLEILAEYTVVDTPRGPMLELVAEQWQVLGVKLNIKEISGDLQTTRAPGNQMDMTVWNADKMTDVLFPATPMWVVPMAHGWENSWCPLWAQWYVTDGKAGEEPPEEMKLQLERWELLKTSVDEAARVEAGKAILRSQATNLWTIGTVGLAPHPVIVRKNLRNVPDESLYGWDTFWTQPAYPEQFFFD